MVGRVMAYSRKVLRLPDKIKQYAATNGYQPRVGVDRILGEAIVMVISRMGSLNALGQTVKKTLEAIVRLLFAVAQYVCPGVCASGDQRYKAADQAGLYPA
jgi:hypothetical protein